MINIFVLATSILVAEISKTVVWWLSICLSIYRSFHHETLCDIIRSCSNVHYGSDCDLSVFYVSTNMQTAAETYIPEYVHLQLLSFWL